MICYFSGANKRKRNLIQGPTKAVTMSLNNIQLSPRMLADLYPNVLIETHAIPMPVVLNLSFLGNNEKKVLIVVNNPEAAFLTENELAFLTKILEACGLNMADVAIINWNNLISKDYKSILETLKSKTVLLFAVDAETFGLPFRFPHFQIQHFDQCIYLQAPALSTIEEDVTAKKQLWTSLKSLFQL
jgi:hypothetical protein